MICAMVAMRNQLGEVNVLASEAGWEWPYALRQIFVPRGVNLLVAEGVEEFVDIMGRRRIHATIIDVDRKKPSGIAMVKIMRMDFPLIPCILLGSDVGEEILGKALELEVFSVIGKPVDMRILREQLNRLFLKKYNSCIFS